MSGNSQPEAEKPASFALLMTAVGDCWQFEFGLFSIFLSIFLIALDIAGGVEGVGL